MKTIIYATNCSTNTASALHYAYRFSLIMKADFHVLHVYELPPVNLSTIHSKETLRKSMQQEQEDIVTKYCETHLKNEFRKNHIIIHAIEDVSITNSIIKLSKKLSSDLVILGMKDHYSERGYFSGNIADTLLDKIEVPLLIVPNGVGYTCLSTIVYATDFEKKDIESIKKLVEIARPFSALIEIIHVFETDKYIARENMERFKNKLLKQVSYLEITFKTIASSKIKSGLLGVLQNEKADLLAMLERKNNRKFNLLPRKDLVKKMEASVSIPILAFT